MFRTQVHGPLYDGRLEHNVHNVVEIAVTEVTREGANMLAAEGRFFRKSGYWESQIQTDRRGRDGLIHDDAIYNDWLAGESERNNTSRFKGYAHWRKTTQKLQALAPRIVARALRRVL